MTTSITFPADHGLTPHTFQRHNRRLRGLMIEQQPWFVLRDVARLTNSHVTPRITQKLDADQLRWERLAGAQEDELLVSESGVYALLLVYFFHPENRSLRQWLCHDVVPALRDAHYDTPGAPRYQQRDIQGQMLSVLEWQGKQWLRFVDAVRMMESGASHGRH
ncbi:Bro-N domain-containing protein [Pseudomonas sp. SCB32]|uniref:BRO-N domain-containing protein n=1 Tax=Pseudomonas sp. SCB32 TaxID=2653853 RepID=UPI001264EA9D|nr:Bro-N domain-containing protein [Pseudomonas sp. SCB32]